MKSVVLAGLVSLGLATSAQAITISVMDGEIDSGFGPDGVYQDFEQKGTDDGVSIIDLSDTFNVGKFETVGGIGSGGTTVGQSLVERSNLRLRNDESGDVFGRENNVPDGGTWWLDSNDTFGIVWHVDLGGKLFDKVTFLLQDVEDVGAEVGIGVNSPGKSPITPFDVVSQVYGSQANRNLKTVTIDFGSGVSEAQIAIVNYTVEGGEINLANDGFGIDGLGVNVVPLPAAAWFLIAGIGALGMVARRKSA